jgi:hypothetical protein
MFLWYQSAESCYAYLCDVDISNSDCLDKFQCSKWFTRGWTLQELLAPNDVTFFDVNWIEFGTKESLAGHVTSITGIKYLAKFEEASIAQKFSWASKRETTRVEDTAYCLMGLFRVNMPLLCVRILPFLFLCSQSLSQVGLH